MFKEWRLEQGKPFAVNNAFYTFSVTCGLFLDLLETQKFH